MSDVKWIKLTTNMFDDEKVRLLEANKDGDTKVILWFNLLLLAGKKNNGGVVFRFEFDKFVNKNKQQISEFLLNCHRLNMVTFYMEGSINESIHIVNPENWYKVDRDCTVDNKINTTMRNYILNRDNWKCVYCGSKDEPFEVDHVLPIARGGLTIESNLVCACRYCNRSKKNRTPEEWSVVVGSL